MAVFFLGVLPNHDFGVVKRWEAGVPAFSGQRYIARGRRNQPAHAQARTRPDNGFGGVFNGLEAAHLHQILRLCFGNGECLRGEVIDKQQRIQFQGLARGFDGKCPVVVGHLQPVAHHGVGNGH